MGMKDDVLWHHIKAFLLMAVRTMLRLPQAVPAHGSVEEVCLGGVAVQEILLSMTCPARQRRADCLCAGNR